MLSVSLIITTYNRPDALAAVLHSVKQQTVLPNEVLIADDGSTDETRQVIEKYQQNYPVVLKHIWRPDDGFRLAECRNRAIAAAQGDYLITIDGDMLLDPNFIADHIRVAQKGVFVQGSRVLLNADKTKELLQATDFSLPKWYQSGVMKRKSAWRLPFLSAIIAKQKTQKLRGIRGCNHAFFREDALAINGFNNDFVGWGREDSEFVVRFFNNGGQRINLKFAAIAFHLYHQEQPRQSLAENDQRLTQAIEQRLTYCENGVSLFSGSLNNENKRTTQ